MNLVTNARDALNQRYGEYHEQKRIELRVQRSARSDWVRVSVRDFGFGIPAEVLPRIFDPFFTTKGRDQGTGLGLAVSHGIAQEHGGDLTVETVLGTVRFILEPRPRMTPARLTTQIRDPTRSRRLRRPGFDRRQRRARFALRHPTYQGTVISASS
jgi:signal transduction histidine kinase